jgi:hypothetical protein
MGSVFLKEKLEELFGSWIFDRKVSKTPYSSFDVNSIQNFNKEIRSVIVSYIIDFHDLDRYDESEAADILFFLPFLRLDSKYFYHQLKKTRSYSLTKAILLHIQLEPKYFLLLFKNSKNSVVRSVMIEMVPNEYHEKLLSIVVEQNNIEDLLQMSNMEINVKKEVWHTSFDTVVRNQINARGVSAYLQLYDLIAPEDRQRIEREFV